jgi:ubiquitin-conjugating enzyme E2 H
LATRTLNAAALYLHKPDDYVKKIKEYVQRYAKEDQLEENTSHLSNKNGSLEHESDSDESTLSDFSENETETMEL